MTTFLRLLAEKDKATPLLTSSAALRAGTEDARVFQVSPDSFCTIPGAPFAYWVSDAVRAQFSQQPAFGDRGRQAQRALSTNNDFRYLRVWWEREKDFALSRPASGWLPFAKGGNFSRFYSDVYLLVNWIGEGREIEAEACLKFPYLNGNAEWILHRECNYLRPGLTWPRRTQGGLSLRALPRGCVFADKGPTAFVPDDDTEALLALLALVNSQAFGLFVSLQMAFGSYEAGVILKTPVPDLSPTQCASLAALSRRAWSLKRALDTIQETSHAFLLPAAVRASSGEFEPSAILSELDSIQSDIDATAFDLYGFSDADRSAVQAARGAMTAGSVDDIGAADDADEEDSASTVDQTDGLLSWAVGVAFGRFDWRLATGERAAPPEPDPFDPLPAKSPGMLPDGAAPFHTHAGILVDDPGHPHDLAHLIEEVLARVDTPVPSDVRRWLQRDFFAFHLQNYSKSRRKAPIYWPLSTASGAYTLWLYYPSLTNQTLYTAVNDFLEGPAGKLKQVEQEAAALRAKAPRSRDEDRKLETLQDLETELIDLRETLLRIAPTYHPNHDDGVQITAAPLWPLFRHKPWQKILKDTWAKLEKGDYDWAHLAMSYWPDRVRKKCKTDKSLAIAHDLENLYVEPEPATPKGRGRRK